MWSDPVPARRCYTYIYSAALLMEWILGYAGSRGVDTLQLKNLLILGARKRPEDAYPNREWGYGMLDLYRTLERLRQI